MKGSVKPQTVPARITGTVLRRRHHQYFRLRLQNGDSSEQLANIGEVYQEIVFFEFVTLVDQQAVAEYFVTVGSDGEIRIWNFNQKYMGFSLNLLVEKGKIEKYEDGALTRLHFGASAFKWGN